MIQVLMDIDETLISVPPGINALSSGKMFQKIFGVNAHEDMINNIGQTEMAVIIEVLALVGISIKTVPAEAYSYWAKILEEDLRDNPVRVLPGMHEFLNALSQMPEVRLRLLTGNAPSKAQAKLASGKIEKYFLKKDGSLDGVFGNTVLKREMLFDIIQQESAQGDRFIIVDDSLLGAQIGKKYSVPMILVATGRASQEKLRQYTDTVFPDLGENRWKEALSLIKNVFVSDVCDKISLRSDKVIPDE